MVLDIFMETADGLPDLELEMDRLEGKGVIKSRLPVTSEWLEKFDDK